MEANFGTALRSVRVRICFEGRARSEFLEVSHDSFHIVTLKIWAAGLNLERNGLTRVRRTVRVSSLASNVKCHRSEVNDRSPGNNP